MSVQHTHVHHSKRGMSCFKRLQHTWSSFTTCLIAPPQPHWTCHTSETHSAGAASSGFYPTATEAVNPSKYMPVRRGTLDVLFSDSTFIDLYSCQTLTLKRKHSFLMFSMRLFSIWPSMARYRQRLFFTALKHQSQRCIQLHVSAFSQLRLTGNILELDCLLCVGTSFLTCKNNAACTLVQYILLY